MPVIPFLCIYEYYSLSYQKGVRFETGFKVVQMLISDLPTKIFFETLYSDESLMIRGSWCICIHNRNYI